MSVIKLSRKDIYKNGENDEKIKIGRDQLSYDSAMVSAWETGQKQAATTLDQYRERINSGGFLSSKDISTYRKALDSYIETSSALRGISKSFGQTVDDDETWSSNISQMETGFKGISDYYSQWKNEKQYNVDKEIYNINQMSPTEYKSRLDNIGSAKNDLDLIFQVNQALVPIEGYGHNATTEERKKYEDFRYNVSALWEKYGKDKYDTVEDFYYGEFYTDGGKNVIKAAEAMANEIAYTTKDGANVTWQQLYDNAAANRDLSQKLEMYSSNIDWDEKSQAIKNVADTYGDYSKVYELSQTATDDNTDMRQEMQDKYGEQYGIDFFDPYADYSKILGDLNKNRGESDEFYYFNQLTDDEKSVLSYMYQTKGRAAALNWYKSRESLYEKRYNNEVAQNAAYFGEINPAFASALSVGTSIVSGAEYLADIFAYAATGEMGYNTAATITSGIRSGVSETVDWEIGNWDAFDFLYNTAMSGVDSYVGGKIGGIFGSAAGLTGKSLEKVTGIIGGSILGLGAAAQGTNDALDRGMNNQQAFWGGLASGAFEMAFEKVSIGNFRSLKEVPADTWKDIARNIGKSMLVNASEETATEIANLFYDYFAHGDLSQYETMIRQYEAQGMSPEKARSEAFWNTFGQVVESGASGALMGFGFGAIGSAGSAMDITKTKNQENAEAKRVYGSDAGALVGEALEIDPDNAFAQKMQGRLDKGKQLSGAQLNRLVQQNEAALTAQDVSAIQSAAESRLADLGETGDVRAIAAALAKQAAGENLSPTEQKLISSSKYGQRVANELNTDNINSEDHSSAWTGKIGTERINVEEYSRLVEAAQQPQEAAEVTAGQVATEAPKAAQAMQAEPVEVPAATVSQYKVSANGKAELDGKEVVLNGLKQNPDGSVVVATADNQSADPAEIKYPTEGHALVYENYANIETTAGNPVIANMDVDTRSTLARAYDPTAGVSAKDYFLGSNQAYWYGFDGIPINEKILSANSLLRSISDEQRTLAYDLGQKAGKQATQTQEAGITKAYETAVEKLGGKEKAKAIAAKKSGKVILGSGIKESGMTVKERASYEMAKVVAKAIGTDIHIYRGMREYGKYSSKTGEIWLNINANISGQSLMAFTLGHELVHMAKQWSPAKFKAFADYLLEQYSKKGISAEELIHEQIANAKLNDYTLNEHEAYEEVIADACQRMLLDSDAVQKMAEYKKENPGQWQQIIDKIKAFIDKIRKAFAGVEPDSKEAALFKELDDFAKNELEKRFVDMVVDAGEHLSVIRAAFGKGTVVEVNADGEFTLAKGEVGGATKFLYNDSTWERGGRDTLSAALKAEGFSKEDINAALTIMDGKHKLVKELAEQFPEQDRINKATITTDLKDGHSVLSALVSNGDYPVNIDLLMVCKKRKAYQRVINRLCETGLIQQATVDALAIAEINKILGKYGFETACLGCFVESRRLRIQEWANTIVKEWNSEVKKRNPDAKAFGFGKGEATLTPDEVMQLVGELEGHEKNDQGNLNLGQGSAVKRMGVLLDKVPSLRKTLSVEDLITPDGLTALRKFDSNLFSMVKSRYGSNSPKFVQEFNPYNHELALYGKVPSEYKSLREYLYAIGGARMQSFSDFIVENWFDYCQIVADLAARKLPMHTYTKEISLAKLFGLTGIKINMSLIPDIDRSIGKEFAGLTRNAKGELELIWADKDRFKATGGKSYMQSINFADAIALQNDPRYSGNVGTIAVGVSDKHILMMLDDNRIRMIIPYHSSGMNPIFADLMGTSYYKDYTMFQNTTVKQLYNSKGQPVSLKLDKTQNDKLVSGFQFNAVLQELGDARAAAQAYKDWCADASKHTITIKGETYTAELTPKFDSFSWHDNYYKLLEDFNTYDCISEQAAPQGDVQQNYPEDFDNILKDELTVQENQRQKHEENQSFDKAMSEIESYLSEHTKADTVFYAEQHGIKLAAKDKKLGATDKAKLADLRNGMKMSMPKVNSEGYDTTRLAWAIETGIINESDQARYWEAIAEIRKLNYNSFARTKNGGFIIETKDKMMFTDGDFKAPTLSKVICFTFEGGKDVDETRRMIRNEAERTGRTNESVSFAEDLYGSWFIAEYNARDYQTYAWQNRRGEGAYRIGTSSESESRGVRHEGEDGVRERRGLKDKTPNSHSISSRQLLADAFDELVQTPDERKLMDEYRNNISMVEDVQERLRKLRAEISKLTKAKGDKAKIDQMSKTAKELAELIDKYDRKLLDLEASKPLKDVLARARSAAYQEARQRNEKTLKEYRQQVSERFDRGVEGRRKTEMRKKIRKTIRDLDKILNRGDKKRNVKEDMKDFVAEALSAAEVLFTDNYTNEDIVRNGFGVELSKEETKYLEEARKFMDELANLPVGSYDAWQERRDAEEKLKSKLAYRMSKLKDAFFRERQRLNKAEVAGVLGNLADAYAKLETSEYAYVNGAYHESVYQYLKMLQEDMGGAKVKDMTLGQLEELHKAYTMVLTTVRNANKMFAEDLKQSKEELANRVMMEVYQAGGEHGLWSKGQLARNQASWNNTKPIYAAERTGSSTFVQLVKGLFKGQYNWAVDMEEAKAFRQKVADKYGFKNWDMEKTYKFTSSSGIEFELNLNQIMSLYAYAKREQAHDHLLKGGFVFGKNTEVVVTKNGIKRTYLNKSAKAHNISDEIMGEIVSKLSKEQRGFVDEMQDYLSTTMGAKGNEVSMRLYGVKLFMEKFYFPLKSAGQFKEKAKEAELKQQQGQVSIVNSGFTNAVTPKASNPVVLDGFTDVWAGHVNEMSLYHSMVLPMEDFRRVYNYASPNMEGQESASVNSFIENAYGDAATGYFDQLYKELNGGAIVDPRENLSKQMIGKFKKAAVMLSNSVWVQQFSAIGRAYALIDPKYFIGPKVDKQKHKVLWAEVKQYAPVAIIKEMGGFDTHTGLSANDYLLAEEYGKGERIKGFAKDKQYRDELMGWLPAKADELTWCAIWEAVKRETKAKNPEMDVKSEEFLKKAGARFSEVIEKTQVYDSVLARSANMRSKNGLMQMLTAFMAEPTTTVNMVEDALRKGHKKVIARTLGAVAASIILNNALVSIIYAMRDDDEDETFLEKYAQAFASGMLDDINPVTYYPILKDIWSLFQGYDVERTDMAIYSDIADSVKKIVTLVSKYDSEMDGEDAAEYYKQVTDALVSLLDAGAAAFGVPLKNVRRDFVSYYNTFKTFTRDGSTTWNSFVDAVSGSALDTIPVVGLVASESNTDKLYDAIVSGDTTYVNRLKSGYKDQNAINNAIRKGLRENDPRIKEAAKARFSGDFNRYREIFLEIKDEGNFAFDDIMGAINAEVNKLEKKAAGNTSKD